MENEESTNLQPGQEEIISDLISDFTPPQDTPKPDELPAIEELPAKEEPPKEEPPAIEEPPKPPVAPETKVGPDGRPLVVEPPKPSEGAPPKEGEPPKANETEEERLKRENDELKRLVEGMANQVFAPKPTQPLTPEQEAEQRRRQEEIAKQVLPFLKDEESFDAATKDAQSMNALLTTVVNTAVMRAVQMLPGITTRYVDRQLSTRLAIQDFFRQNEDLIPYRQYLGFVYNEIAAKHADWDMSQVLKESEKEVRSRLSIARQNPGASPEPGRAGATRTAENQPAFVPKGGSRKGQAQTDVRTGEEKQIEDLIS